jgi:ATP-binding cassette subfamily B protein
MTGRADRVAGAGRREARGPGLFAALERSVGTSREVMGLVALYGVSAVAQGGAFALAIPLLRDVLGQGSASQAAWAWFFACVVLAGAAHLTALLRSARVSVYAICDRALRRLGDKVANIALGWFDSSSAAKVSKAMADDILVLSNLGPVVLPGLITGVGTPLTVAVVCLFVELEVGLALIVAAPVGALCVRWSVRVLERVHPLERAAGERMVAAVLEDAALQPLLRASGRVGLKWDHVADAVAADSEAELGRMSAEGRPSLVFQFAVQGCFAAALVAAAAAAAAGRIDVATFAVLCLLAVRCVEPLTLAVQYSNELFRSRTAALAIAEILEAPELPESDRPERPTGCAVELSGVTFGYRPEEPVLRDVELAADAGEVVVLTGVSGAGKSTLARLVARFWDVDSGAVRIGGVDVRQMTGDDLMRHVAFVFQDVFLFDTTVRENIRVGRPSASQEDIRAAASAARLDDVIEHLPQGWDTPVGQGGSLLSGGERQRVAIARALLKGAPVLLLDEISSALDAVNEAALLETLRQHAQGRVVIMIAHRAAATAAADRVLVVADGQVAESGSSGEL